MISVEKAIDQMDMEKLRGIVGGNLPFDPYPYQWATTNETTKEIRDYQHPFIVKAAVSAGKTVMISMICRRLWAMQTEALVLSRSGEIVEQDNEEMRNFSIYSPIFCASLKSKSTGNGSPRKQIISGSEGTVVNGLTKELKDFTPRFLLVDECHEVNITDIIASELANEDSLDEMKDAKRSSYTLIIREFQRRCLERYGKPMVIIGYTGTDYRGREPIVNEFTNSPGFWRKRVIDIDTDYLIKFGSVVPTNFGVTTNNYDLSDWHLDSDADVGASDYTSKQLQEMQQRILSDGRQTAEIMLEVQRIAANRNSVLVTCSGLQHCQEAASALLPGTTYGIVTTDTPDKDRIKILDAAKRGEIKYIFQIGCLTTGINCPPWDTIVILRKIGSLTLLVQLIGRGMRLLKQFHKDAGMVKEDNLVLDYTGTMNEMSELYFSSFLEQYQYQNSSQRGETMTCGKCSTINSIHARRCIGEDLNSPDGRCEEFFCKPNVCSDVMHPRIKDKVLSKGCNALNDPSARNCRLCGNQLIDPNANLSGKHYTKDDYCDVVSFDVQLSKCGNGIAVEYVLKDPNTEEEFKAWEIHWPFNYKNRGSREAWKSFINTHCFDKETRSQLFSCKSSPEIENLKGIIAKPDRVTHRKANNGKHMITHKVFNEPEF